MKSLLQRVLVWDIWIKCYGSTPTTLEKWFPGTFPGNVDSGMCVESEVYHTKWQNTVHIKEKVQLSLYLIKHHATKTYGEVEV
jgi:hypothetical protein